MALVNLSYSVVVTRDGMFDGPDDRVVIGPFRRRELADKRAAIVRALADKYEDPEGQASDDNCLSVEVVPIRSARTSAQTALDYLYGSIG